MLENFQRQAIICLFQICEIMQSETLHPYERVVTLSQQNSIYEIILMEPSSFSTLRFYDAHTIFIVRVSTEDVV